MSKSAGFSLLLIALAPAAMAAEIPNWAYPVNPPAAQTVPDDGSAKHVPDSTAAFTRAQLSAIARPVCDWHPDEHPAMPDIVAKGGHAPKVFACGYCHLPNGAGRPENTSLSGLTPGYFKQQVAAFRNGDRPGSEPNRAPQTGMITIAKGMTDAEIDAAAAYFASIKPACFVKVIEADTVPRTTVSGWMLARAPGGGTEPIGNRIVEITDDMTRFENRDSRTPYIAYVPPGSVKRGAELVATGSGKTLACAICHGPQLKGLADIPRLTGRSPGYLVRQMYDIRHGARKGAMVELMKPVVANLSDEDMVAIAAYLASREP